MRFLLDGLPELSLFKFGLLFLSMELRVLLRQLEHQVLVTLFLFQELLFGRLN